MIKLSDYQNKILDRLRKGEILYRSRLGPFTGSYHFQGYHKEGGINEASITKLYRAGLVKKTDKMTMYGPISYVHIPAMTPWKNDASWQQYQGRYYK